MIQKTILLLSFLICFKISYNQHVINFYIPECPWVNVHPSDLQSSQLKVYPNPAHDFLCVEHALFNLVTQTEIDIFDVFGKRIFSKGGLQGKENKIVIDVSKFSKAVYIIRIKTENGIIDKKFVVF